jgi:hypothetical protein
MNMSIKSRLIIVLTLSSILAAPAQHVLLDV